MRTGEIVLRNGHGNVVGSFGNARSLRDATLTTTRTSCDLAEIRLDLLAAEGADVDGRAWEHLAELPLLFTARRIDEGGALALDAAHRSDLLRGALEYASLVDVEVASMGEMREVIDEAATLGVRWVASCHDFSKLPDDEALWQGAHLAKEAGAAVFKVAAWLRDPGELARLAVFQQADHGLPVASMGMGPLAAASRILCAQCGSVLNYGYLGTTPTAPGQWEAGLLKRVISGLAPLAP
jgi:3-dehydroquinate dehydratase I